MCILSQKARMQVITISSTSQPLQETPSMDSLRNRIPAPNVNENTPPKFQIPILKAVGPATTPLPMNGLNVLGARTTATSSKLNEFLLAQLNEKRNNGEISTTGFTLPKLQLGGGPTTLGETTSTSTSGQFVIPLLQNNNTPTSQLQSHVATLSKGMQNLKMATEDGADEKVVIDLTAALSTPNMVQASASGTHLEARGKSQAEEFDIPFIGCDRRERKQATLLPTANDYCETDISTKKLRHSLAAPSSFGRILCLHYGCTQPYARIDHSFSMKHDIQPFSFDTPSPDDKVLATLGKYQRLQ